MTRDEINLKYCMDAGQYKKLDELIVEAKNGNHEIVIQVEKNGRCYASIFGGGSTASSWSKVENLKDKIAKAGVRVRVIKR